MMYCKKCGHQISENEEFCVGCKTSVLELKSTDNIIYKKNTDKEIKVTEENGINPIINEFTPKKDNVKSEDTQDFFGNNQYDASKYMDSTRVNTLLLKSVIVILSLLLIAIGSYLIWDKIINVSIKEETSTVNYEGITLNIPNGFIYEVVNNSLYISDSDITWNAQISIADLSFNQLTLNKETLNDELITNYDASEAVQKRINEKDYLVMDAVNDNNKFVIAISKASNTKIFIITTYYSSINSKYDSLNKLSNILNSVKVNKNAINSINNYSNDISNILLK